jgi:MoxR-like ATPase
MLWLCNPDDRSKWTSSEMSEQIMGGVQEQIPIEWVRTCAFRVHKMRNELRNNFVGSKDYINWLIATLIARENILLLGPPGIAKSQIATRIFDLLGLSLPEVNENMLREKLKDTKSIRSWWSAREKEEHKKQKYFHYLLGKFTQPEELFGPIEISLLKQGVMSRVNFGLLTGPGVRAAFLDEIFKASSSILNTLLSLINERQYFNWGGMVPADLMFVICASNEMPGGFGSSNWSISSGAEDFQLLYAFLDRFPIRINVPTPSGTSDPNSKETQLTKASDKAIERESRRFSKGKEFKERDTNMPCINDILLLGRYCLQHKAGENMPCLFNDKELRKFERIFFSIAKALQQNGTKLSSGRITWTISPRKLKSLYKIGLVHALVRDDNFKDNAQIVSELGEADLEVFNHIWDTSIVAKDLKNATKNCIKSYWHR